ncbi:hypothetical protein LROSL1_2545 [Furfurilactobacillus rossiae]|uniref:1-acyl-sn-glycerol-3-phosphate acyltransferase n=1 Tax=Furfurilactobacillus rossiae TaxID=231049 RepID=UPI0015C0B41E|nr:1-acyl-sn-glycerol-3-phosphate acyltransferase [Furfurilactobacillus rossiae]MCF6165175.1 1-acyl-sn-glycerol-3-phosphate acyltransferase [Furfurilactobacillus rossiae]QLE65345.1 hypothetical protein LROSL1_2545 [Furfurilactobacillus rossiae]
MIVADHRDQVIDNIRQAIAAGRFNDKVEVGDPILSTEAKTQAVDNYLKRSHTFHFKIANWIARTFMAIATWLTNRTTTVSGWENLSGLAKHQGAIITTNHFNPLENTVPRLLARHEHRRLFIVSQDTNLAMTGGLGYLMNNLDIIPLSKRLDYLGRELPALIQKTTAAGHFVLIYPEQEMWFNYRKPRPPKRGTYYYAAKANVPIISCFTEIRSEKKLATPEFHETSYHLHILPLIYPDPKLSANANATRMMNQDYAQKKAAYEAAYHEPLSYQFEPQDIVGWIPDHTQQ